MREFIAERLAEIEHDLAAVARDSSIGANQGDAAFSAAFLIARSDEPRLLSVVETLGVRLADHGFTFELGGPWPPYHFTDLRLEADDG